MPMRRGDDFCRDSVRSWRDARPRIDLYGAFRKRNRGVCIGQPTPLEPPRRGDRLRASTKSARVVGCCTPDRRSRAPPKP